MKSNCITCFCFYQPLPIFYTVQSTKIVHYICTISAYNLFEVSVIIFSGVVERCLWWYQTYIHSWTFCRQQSANRVLHFKRPGFIAVSCLLIVGDLDYIRYIILTIVYFTESFLCVLHGKMKIYVKINLVECVITVSRDRPQCVESYAQVKMFWKKYQVWSNKWF